MKSSSWPEVGDYVVCDVTNVTDFGAYVQLDEYKDKEGFIHISEIKAGWVKYVRDHIREGQKVVCKVLNIDTGKGHIDLSLKDVNEHQRRTKIQLWKNEQKAEKWLQIAAENTGFGDESIEEIFFFLVDNFGSAYSAFEEATIRGEKAFDDLGITPEMVKSIVDVAKENIKDAFVEIAGFVDLSINDSNGVEIIKEALYKADSVVNDDDIQIEITYTGAPRYRIKVTAPDYKKAEAALKKSSAAAVNYMNEMGGTAVFNRRAESN
ncbi:MAG: translation initiation factor IF-2 subunit alpha [Methanosarcinaceae archaeon]|nr:translation initiation factor IF-2 subunit alpha [Methanosarcinaceae archaeon]